MRYVTRLLIATLALLLWGAALWANIGSPYHSELRGAWIKYTMRGPAGVI
jgi:hypothetical protein